MKIEMDAKLLQENAENAAQLLTAMANQKRLMILCHLLDTEKSVGEIASLVDLGQSPLSQHLAKLRALGLVSSRRVGQSIRYRVASCNVEKVLKTLYGIYCMPG
jgi:ArsR family transcriptional regulator, virulence genes transcriptional regulator